MTTKPFKIDKAGLYITRVGRTVEVYRQPELDWADEYPWQYQDLLTPGHTHDIRTDGSWHMVIEPHMIHDEDIVAKATAKGKKAKRRYSFKAHGRGDDWSVRKYEGTICREIVAERMSRADARAFCQMKNKEGMK